MDDELLPDLYRRLLHDPILASTRNCTFSDGLILFIFFFGVFCQRSGRWACRKRHWPIIYRRLAFPSYSQFNRRLNRPHMDALIEQLNAEQADRLPRSGLKFADGKPLPVGGFSKDPDATVGHVPRGFARGYKAHVLVDSLGAIERFDVTGLGDPEPNVLHRTLEGLTYAAGENVLIRADSAYDSNRLYARVHHCGARLIANRKKPFTGLGHREHHGDRVKAIKELEASTETLNDHRRLRATVERRIGHLANLPFGLWALPPSVRRLKRVKRWVRSKIFLYHCHLASRLAAA